MAQFDVHRLANDSTLVLDCQSNLLSHIDSRLVVPLVPGAEAPPPAGRLNPTFSINGQDYVMLTQAAAAIRVRELGPVVATLIRYDIQVTGALDVLITGV